MLIVIQGQKSEKKEDEWMIIWLDEINMNNNIDILWC